MSTAKKTTISAQSPVNNQGLIFFTTQNADKFTMYISPDILSDPSCSKDERYFCLKVDKGEATVSMKLPGNQNCTEIMSETADDATIDTGVLVTYWLSFSTSYDEDKKSFIPELKYGKGFAMQNTILMKTDPKMNIDGNVYDELFTYKTTKYVQVVQEDSGVVSAGDEPYLSINKTPHTCDPSPVITNSETATLMDINRGTSLSSMLPEKIRILFDTVKNLELDRDLAEAIEYSLNTDGMLLHTFVEDKRDAAVGEDGGFAEDEVYIRVTLGLDIKLGVGIPFVLEIWPSKMGSPIHNHGNAAAVIKVLHGEINVTNYNKLVSPSKSVEEIKKTKLTCFDCKKGDMTWMTKNYFQVHQLKNEKKDYCATIQCYLYDGGDRIHYPAFDFVSQEGTEPQLEPFYPETDFKYHDFYFKLMHEYYDHLQEEMNTGTTSKRGLNQYQTK